MPAATTETPSLAAPSASARPALRFTRLLPPGHLLAKTAEGLKQRREFEGALAAARRREEDQEEEEQQRRREQVRRQGREGGGGEWGGGAGEEGGEAAPAVGWGGRWGRDPSAVAAPGEGEQPVRRLQRPACDY